MKARYLFRVIKARYRDQRRELQAILNSIRRGDVAVDVGAHKGAYLYWLRRAVGSTGQVIACEPQPRLAAYLQSVCAGMNWQNVSVHACALSDQAGRAVLHVPGDSDSPGASLNQAVLAHQPGVRYECPMDTLDHLVAGLGPVTALKVDVEGHELKVFRGGADVLARDRPVILFECEQRHLQDHTMREVFAFLEDLGYAGAFFSPQGLLPLAEFDPNVHQKQKSGRFWDEADYCNNFLFRPRT